MYEYIWAIFLFDETEAFSFVEEFYFTDYCIRHIKNPVYIYIIKKIVKKPGCNLYKQYKHNNQYKY
ncbi:hypothetical protein FMO003_14630 [Moritella sp. F3]|nr:hypothetical protein FMO003_14630 [Moritella sp. F3]